MRFAYADPPYFGRCASYDHEHGDGGCWDDIATHAALIVRLADEYPDGWAFSCSTPSLRHLLPGCPDKVRVCAWVKTYCTFRPGVNPAYAWEPVLLLGGRKRDREHETVRDWYSSPTGQRLGIFGGKPASFAAWVSALLGATNDDRIEDLFSGSGTCGRQFDQGLLL